MEDDRGILDKADALLKRHAAPFAGPGGEDEVPVLTDLVAPGSGTAPASAVPPHETAPAPPLRAVRLEGDDFSRELVAEVVGAVQSRLAQDIERRLTQQVMGEVHAAVAATLADLRQDIANAVGDAVAEALARHPRR